MTDNTSPVTPELRRRVVSRRRSATPPPATLNTLLDELKGLRRDMVVLCRVIVESQQRAARSSVTKSLQRAEQPGSLSANVQMPSWYDAIFEADQEANAG